MGVVVRGAGGGLGGILILNFCTLNDSQANRLKQQFTEEEIEVALRELNGEKALGPDGF